jgi:chloramphenicol 3-O phosphotransferase
MTSAPLIVLNGPSSAGKTTLVKALQAQLPVQWLACGLDVFLDMLPQRVYQPPLWDQLLGRLSEGGPLAHDLVRDMHTAIAALARAGRPLLVDHVLLHEAWAADARKQWAGLPVLWVGVTCPLPELQRRERARGDRASGAAEAQHLRVHAHMTYDVMVDTHAQSIDACATTVVSALTGRAGAAAT